MQTDRSILQCELLGPNSFVTVGELISETVTNSTRRIPTHGFRHSSVEQESGQKRHVGTLTQIKLVIIEIEWTEPIRWTSVSSNEFADNKTVLRAQSFFGYK